MKSITIKFSRCFAPNSQSSDHSCVSVTVSEAHKHCKSSWHGTNKQNKYLMRSYYISVCLYCEQTHMATMDKPTGFRQIRCEGMFLFLCFTMCWTIHYKSYVPDFFPRLTTLQSELLCFTKSKCGQTLETCFNYEHSDGPQSAWVCVFVWIQFR